MCVLATCNTLRMPGLERAGEHGGVESDNVVVLDVHYSYIDVTGVIAIAMDIWSDHHAGIP